MAAGSVRGRAAMIQSRSAETGDMAGKLAVQSLVAQIVQLNQAIAQYDRELAQLMAEHPDITLIIPHMGMLNGGQERVQAQFRDNPNIHFDTSLGQVNETIVQTLGASRLLYGCDYPYGWPADNLRRVQRLQISAEEKELMLSGNVKRLLQIS